MPLTVETSEAQDLSRIGAVERVVGSRDPEGDQACGGSCMIGIISMDPDNGDRANCIGVLVPERTCFNGCGNCGGASASFSRAIMELAAETELPISLLRVPLAGFSMSSSF